MTVDKSTLNRWCCLLVLTCLQALGAYLRGDRDNVSTTAKNTQPAHVGVAGYDWELFINGLKFYETRAKIGGGGVVDLVMYLWGVPFKGAVRMVIEARA